MKPLSLSEIFRITESARDLNKNHFQAQSFDAVEVDRILNGEVCIFAGLRVLQLDVDPDGVLAESHPWYGGPIEIRWIPQERVVWLFHGPNPPAREACVPWNEPLLSLPGELEAYKIRRLAGFGPAAMADPSSMVEYLTGLELEPRIRSPNSDLMYCGFQRADNTLDLVCEWHDGADGYREASVGMSLAIWFLSPHRDSDVWTIDWGMLPLLSITRPATFWRVFNVYGALRLPALRLLLELRSTRMSRSKFIQSFAGKHWLPIGLVTSRLKVLRASGLYPHLFAGLP